MYDQTASIDAFLQAVAGERGVPAGGCAAALAGAMAAALGSMVMSISAGKEGLQPLAGRQQATLEEFTRAQSLLTHLMVEDQVAYSELLAARRMPHWAAGCDAAVQAAVMKCIRAPQAITSTAVVVLEACARAVEMSHRPLLADLAVGADLAMAAVRGGANLMRVNARELDGPDARGTVELAADELLRRGQEVIQELYPRIWIRDAQK